MPTKKAAKAKSPTPPQPPAEGKEIPAYSDEIRTIMAEQNRTILVNNMNEAMFEFTKHRNEQYMYDDINRAWQNYQRLNEAIVRRIKVKDD